MRVIHRAQAMQRLAQRARRAGRRIGFVPTMGALHGGHLSLVRAARRQHELVVASIFVNPLQFGPREDYAKYPRPLARDRRLLASAGCDVLFAPSVADIYPDGFATSVDVAEVSGRWEGALRPGHFRGVATVVLRLLNLVQPATLYLGQKDYQQARVLTKLVEDLALPVVVRIMPTIREPDGLAMSSRNVYLATAQRREAVALIHALRLAQRRMKQGERAVTPMVAAMRQVVRRESSARIEYLAVVDANTLSPLTRVLRGRVAILGAIRLGSTRLIDNLLVDVP